MKNKGGRPPYRNRDQIRVNLAITGPSWLRDKLGELAHKHGVDRARFAQELLVAALRRDSPETLEALERAEEPQRQRGKIAELEQENRDLRRELAEARKASALVPKANGMVDVGKIAKEVRDRFAPSSKVYQARVALILGKDQFWQQLEHAASNRYAEAELMRMDFSDWKVVLDAHGSAGEAVAALAPYRERLRGVA